MTTIRTLALAALAAAPLAAAGTDARAQPGADPSIVQVEIAAPADEVRGLVIDAMKGYGADLQEDGEARLTFRAPVRDRTLLSAMYGCRVCADPYGAFQFLIIPQGAGTVVMGRYWHAVPQPDGSERRLLPDRNFELQDIEKMLRRIAQTRTAPR